MTKVNIPTFKLNNGVDIPAVGYGTWVGLNDKLEFLSEDIPKLEEAMRFALDAGFRHIDTAHLYRVEAEVGRAVSQKITEGVVKREDVFITTKVWNHNHRPADVEASVKGSLQRLGLDYIDCVLMHWPMSISVDGVDEKIDYVETWRGFESVLRQGLTKSIGVSNFNVDQLTRLLANSTVAPAINQVEINLNLGQKDLVDFCKKNNIQVVAYTPFGSLYRNAPAGAAATRHDDPALVILAEKHGKTVPQVALRYLGGGVYVPSAMRNMTQGEVTASLLGTRIPELYKNRLYHIYQRGIVSIPKSITKSRILENGSIFDFELDEQDVKTLQELDNGYRTVLPSFWQNYENYPFKKIDGEIPKIPATLLAP